MFFIAIICAILFYSHQFIPEFDKEYKQAEQLYNEAKKKNTLALTKIKEYSKGTILYQEYKEVNAAKKEAFKNWNKVIEKNKVFGFKSIRYFIERFGLMLCIFMYALYNLIKSYLREPKNIGAKFIHTFIISITFFYFYWIFQQFQDVSRFTYYFMTVFSAILVTLAVYLITKYNKDRITKLRQQLLKVSLHSLRNVRPEKEQETFTMLKEIAHDK
ncbi:conserved membrane hypothetical protein [Tenacibaculum sp. 190524A02b]|uniref:Uncharacterized protein n=1 Tax=Tenacibaculum vairaonense TaxID=3137860 RepID=A0ABP1FB24_9FLAO